MVSKSIPKKNKHEKEKWWTEEVLKIAEKIREMKSKGEKERYIPNGMQTHREK